MAVYRRWLCRCRFLCNVKPRLLSTLTFYICLPVCLRWLQFSVPEWNRRTVSEIKEERVKCENQTPNVIQRSTIFRLKATKKYVHLRHSNGWLYSFLHILSLQLRQNICMCMMMMRVLPLFSMIPAIFCTSLHRPHFVYTYVCVSNYELW